ncbi:MAG TPA: PRC-barrel domain-containing protein, partial [Afifellaceae bacterium]|nr:PRC-barrel domain-containing protein [Afifellaceae bacterium]
MIRSLMASTALLALVTTGALAQQQPADQTQQPQAQQQPADQQMQTQQPGATSDAVKQTQEPGEVLADDLIGQTVYSGRTEDAESIGDISDLVLDQEGSVTAVVVGIGGFLGIGQRDVALNFEELEFTQDENGELMIVVSATREELEAAPEFEQTDETRLYGGLGEDERSTARIPPRDQAAQDQQTAEQPDQQPQDRMAQDQTAQQPEATGQPQDQMAQQPEATGQPQDQMAQQPEATGQPQDQMAQQPEATGQPQDQMAQQEQTAQPPEQQMAAGGSQEIRFLTASETGDTRASNWIGQSVVTAEDEEIGEVQDLLVEDSGRTEAVLVDVGGFLETEKQVAIPFDVIQVEQQDGEEVRLVVNMSREELEQAPAYQSDEAVAAQDQQPQGQMDQQPQDQAAQQPQDQAAQQG